MYHCTFSSIKFDFSSITKLYISSDVILKPGFLSTVLFESPFIVND